MRDGSRANAVIAPDTIFHLASCGKQFTGLGVLMLAAAKGSTIAVRTEGEEAQECAAALQSLFENGFNEA